MMKYEWKKHGKEIYGVKEQPRIIDVPRQNYIMISGKGNPNNEDFEKRVGVLYSLAWPIKMRYKVLCKSNVELYEQSGYQEYAIFPLEGIWTSSNPNDPLDKDSYMYTIMIRQPDWITKEMFQETFAIVEKKKPNPLLKEVVFDTIEDGLCVQKLHKGSFDDEPMSFAKMDEFIKGEGYTRINHFHREIYLNDARKTDPQKRQTILSYQVKYSNQH